MINILEKNIIISLIEVSAQTGRNTISIKRQIMLLSIGLKTDQIGDLEHALDNLRDKRKLIVHWEFNNNLYQIELSENFPISNISSIERDQISNLRIRRILLFRLYEEYLKTKDRFVHVPLVTMAEPLEVSSNDIFMHVKYLDSKYYLDYGVMDGGQCTSDITEFGIDLCENHDDIFDQFSAVKIKITGEDEPIQYEGDYVSKNRIDELLQVKQKDFDLGKLVQLCKEANIAYKNGCILSLSMIQRTIINHVPPILGYTNFTEIVNNYNGGRSFKQLMERLDSSLRKVADLHVHQPIKKKESLPEMTQVDFKSEIDVLLSEIIDALTN